MKKINQITKIFFLIALLISFAGFSQLSKTHYIPPITCGDGQYATAEEQVLYISTPSLTPVNFKIIQLGGQNILGTVSRNSPYEYAIGNNSNTPFIVDIYNTNSVVSNKGFVIEASDLIYATIRLNGGESNQAGQITSKGLAALGNEFRIGAFTNKTSSGYNDTYITFASILATENNTTVTFSKIKTGVSLVNLNSGNSDFSITLNNGQSYVLAVQGPSNANRDGLIGTKISASKNIAVNCGSATGTNGYSNTDYGIDQLVPAERTGTEYIFIKSSDKPSVEVPLLVSNEDLDITKVFLNGNMDNLNPDFTINPGEYLNLNGTNFSANRNLYVRTDKKVFAFQSVGDDSQNNLANQNMFFVPPLSCETPKRIDNIPAINKVGNKVFNGHVTITTLTGSTLTFSINGTSYDLPALLFAGYTINGPNAIIGNPNYVTYTISGLTGNVSVNSTGELYLAALGSNGAATFGGYYSGFTNKPEISYSSANVGQTNCLPNTTLTVNSLTDYNLFQWYENGTAKDGATDREFSPQNPGYYKVKATLTACGYEEFSDDIPVSFCAEDYDNDGVNDNIDIDLDNDGIVNCEECNIIPQINLTNITSGIILTNPIFPVYQNSFGGQVNTSTIAATNPVIGNIDGSVITEIPAGKSNFVTYKFSLTPITRTLPLGIKYITTGASTDLLNSDSEYIVKVPLDKTISVLNPTNQLLIDTNYDGIYESNVTEFTAFEIRFRYNGTIPLAAGTGTFSFKTINSNSITLTHINLSETNANKTSFMIFSDCIRDSYQGGISRKYDLDCDDDGILDFIEAQGSNRISRSNIDSNHDGLDDAFGTGIIPVDTDNDGIPDYLDRDSDNDGIYDLYESGKDVTSLNTSFGAYSYGGNNYGTNGLFNAVETITDSGILNYTLSDIDNDGLPDYIDSDSDGDDCFDVLEAGFTDANNDGYLGNASPTLVDPIGRVAGVTDGYTTPNNNYSLPGIIDINLQPTNTTTCIQDSATFSVNTNTVTSYQWQVSSDNGVTWSNVSNNTNYSGATSNQLQLNSIPANFTNNKYRVEIQKIGNSCGKISNDVQLNLLSLPVINSPVTIVQCEDDATIDGFSLINLTQVQNNSLSTNFISETFSYYKSEIGAKNQDANQLISNPLSYSNSQGNTVWVRVVNSDNCYAVGQISIIVTSSQIPSTFLLEFSECDDEIAGISTNTDGFSTFNFSDGKNQVLAQLPSTNSYSVRFYTNSSDALSETNAIPETGTQYLNLTSFRNTTANSQFIWVRVESDLTNECYALGAFIKLNVDERPNIKLTDEDYVCLNNPQQNIVLTAGILDNTPTSQFTFDWYKNDVQLNIFTPTLSVNQVGEYKLIVTSLSSCSLERIISVKSSEIAILENITIQDLSDSNIVIVTVSGTGIYSYSIDAPNNFQDLNQFDNITSGLHNVYVKDKNGCGILGPLEITVMSAPKFFTPNGDGYNDTWNISGFNSSLSPNVLIKIFDRYGKLIKQINPLGKGWDGTFNGDTLQADDYWFSLEFEDGRIFKSHFSLKR